MIILRTLTRLLPIRRSLLKNGALNMPRRINTNGFGAGFRQKTKEILLLSRIWSRLRSLKQDASLLLFLTVFFQTTGIPVAVLVMDRSREKGGKNENRKDVFFIEASKEFKANKAQNILADENIEKIYSAYKKHKDIEKFARKVSFKEIEENDFNLNITRYVDTFTEEAPVDIKANLKELAELEPELEKLEKQMVKYLKELGIK